MYEFSVPTNLKAEAREDSLTGENSKNKYTIAVAALGAVLAAGSAYLFYRANRLERELTDLRAAIKSELVSLQQSSDAAQARNLEILSELRQQLRETGAKSAQAVAQANISAKKVSEQLERKIADTQNETKQYHQTLAAQLGEMQQSAAQTKDKVSSVATQVSSVKTEVAQTKTQVAQTRTQLERTLSELKTMRGDLGVQSGLIATNARELAALRARGERDYFEFQVLKSKDAQRIASDIAVFLRKADPKHNRYTIHLVADDKRVEKKDRNINEPVQFYMSRARVPFEIVINEVREDRIVGYLAAPKSKSPAVASQAGRP